MGSFKRPPMKKVATQKTQRGLLKKTSDKKRGNLKKCKGVRSKRPLINKEATLKNAQGLTQKDLR
jgi:hypothetical protein